MVPRLFRIVNRRQELENVASITIVPIDGTAPAFSPGQFHMLYAYGVGEAAISISSEVGAGEALVHTIRAVGPVSGALCRLRPGDMVGVRGPFGSGWPLESQAGRHLLFVAGGLGLAPLRPAILHAMSRRSAFRSITLLVGARSPTDLLYSSELDAWAEGGALRLAVTVDRATTGWTGMVGVVTIRLDWALAGQDPAAVSAFVCGPEIMMRLTCRALADAGVPTASQWVSMERNMKCAIGTCGHCQFGADFICRDGPVLRWDRVAERLRTREI